MEDYYDDLRIKHSICQDGEVKETKPVDISDDRISQPEKKKKCVQCGTFDTPLWRSGPKGAKSMCNACGIRWKRRCSPAAAKKKRKPPTIPVPGPGIKRPRRTAAARMENLDFYLEEGEEDDGGDEYSDQDCLSDEINCIVFPPSSFAVMDRAPLSIKEITKKLDDAQVDFVQYLLRDTIDRRPLCDREKRFFEAAAMEFQRVKDQSIYEEVITRMAAQIEYLKKELRNKDRALMRLKARLGGGTANTDDLTAAAEHLINLDKKKEKWNDRTDLLNSRKRFERTGSDLPPAKGSDVEREEGDKGSGDRDDTQLDTIAEPRQPLSDCKCPKRSLDIASLLNPEDDFPLDTDRMVLL